MNDELTIDIDRRLTRMEVAYRAMFHAPAPMFATELDARAKGWAAQLTGADDARADAAAQMLLRYLVPEAEAARSTFWATALGRALARVGYAATDEDGKVPSAAAAAALGITRQRAHDLQRAGRLLTPAQLGAEMREREAA